ncbi:hypothetical protein Lser_V15G01637 [Lactuca serriola]
MENDKNINTIERPPIEMLLKKIQELEKGHAHLKESISKLIISDEYKKSVSPGRGGASQTFSKTESSSYRKILPPRRENNNDRFHEGGGAAVDGGGAMKLTENQYINILQTMGQALHVFDLTGRIIYWNQMAQSLYGYTVGEAIGKTAPDIIIPPNYSELATIIIHRGLQGERWSGEFPVRNKRGQKFTVITNVSPFHDENGTIRGATCISTDSRPFREIIPQLNVNIAPWRISSSRFGLDDQQPLQTAIASKISNLASKFKSKIKTRENNEDDFTKSGDYHYYDIAPCDHTQDMKSPYGHFTVKPSTDSSRGSEKENKPGIHEVLSSKAEAWLGKKGISWPWKGNESDQDHDYGPQTSSSASIKVETQMHESFINTNEAPKSLSSSCGASSSGRNVIYKIDIDIDNLDVEVSWDDLVINEQIGQGSCGTVYHGLWYGSDVAIKMFRKQEYPEDVILSFRKEVSLMKRLRHPNILLFMGAVTSPHHLCIVSEFLPRGSLFGLLQRNTTKLDWRRRIHMAMDIARGMNYLHHCNPPIIHRDLKSSNLLVDKNWTVKVGDFGISRIKHETYLSTNTGKGTPQWMAPDVLRNEQVDEKSDVYSYGVVLWELTTEKIPWDNLNSMQVIGAVGFMNKRLEIPKDIDPQWASLIESCWSSEPKSRPTFQEILIKLKDLQRKLVIQTQVPRRVNSNQKGS